MSVSVRRWARSTVFVFAVGCALAFVSPARAASIGQPVTLPFPRLAIMLPSRVQQPLDDIARYDWVRLALADAPLVPRLKILNPDLIALPYVNSCNVPYNASPDAGPQENEELRAIPAQWLLTQVGSCLAEDVSASATSLHVDRVSVVVGGKTVMLFVPGDTVVIDDELAYVQAVDSATGLLTVRRGVVRLAVPHAADTRVAATISDWPHTLVMDASTFCPKATVDPAVGPETWGEYEARMVAGIMADPVWDGVYLDTTRSTESDVIKPNCARTIDPDRSDTPISDYSAFDAAWADGILSYETRVRALVGDSRIVLANCGMPNYDLLNGDVLECFPDDSGTWYSKPWHTALFGPFAISGSYFEWAANARQPNLTTILTYDNDARPTQDDPATSPDFVPNYRKMRFGLCTALLNDGFFSYDLHAKSASPSSLWFDEYDDAGRGRGYLGQALGSARRALGSLATPNFVPSGAFDTVADLSDWLLSQSVGYRGTVALDTADKTVGSASVRIDVSETGANCYGLRFKPKESVPIVQGAEYTLSFWAKADRTRAVRPYIYREISSPDTAIDFRDVALTTTWQHFEVPAIATKGDANGGLIIALAQSSGSVWFDDMSLQRGSSDVWRRDFQGGVSLVNASTSSVTVPLGEVLQKIKGTQVPTLNDGSLVARVTLPPRDGLILLRPTGSLQGIAAQAAAEAFIKWRHCVSLTMKARDYHAGLVRRSTGALRIRATRARLAWQHALTAARQVRTQLAACRVALANGDVASARRTSDAARVASSRAWAVIVRACRVGGARGGGTAARTSAVTGREQMFTVQTAVSALH